MKKTISIALMIILMMTMFATVIYASGANYSPNEVNFDTSNVAPIENLGFKIVGIVRVIGTIASVVILIVLGIKYMMGSAEEKAEYKKTLFPYLIGAIFIFAASNLASMVYEWASTIGK